MKKFLNDYVLTSNDRYYLIATIAPIILCNVGFFLLPLQEWDFGDYGTFGGGPMVEFDDVEAFPIFTFIPLIIYFFVKKPENLQIASTVLWFFISAVTMITMFSGIESVFPGPGFWSIVGSVSYYAFYIVWIKHPFYKNWENR